MKRLVVSFVIFVVMMGVCIAGSRIVTGGSDTLKQDISEILDVADNSDYATAKEKINKFLVKWKSWQNAFIPFVAMERVDEISKTAAELPSLCNKESHSHLMSTLARLKWLVSDVKDAERLSLFSFI